MFLSLVPPSSFSEVVIPRLRTTVPQKVIPRLRSNRQGIFELILSCPRRHFLSSCHSTAFSSSCHTATFFLFQSYRNIFSLPVTPACFFICHSGLRAGVQVNIDSLITWIPGQARNDKRKQKKLVASLMAAAAPNGNHYSHSEIVHIISIALSWHPNISSKSCLGRCPHRAFMAPKHQ